MQSFEFRLAQAECCGQLHQGVSLRGGDVVVEEHAVQQGKVRLSHGGLRRLGEAVEDASEEVGLAFGRDASAHAVCPGLVERRPLGGRAGAVKRCRPGVSGAGQAQIVMKQTRGGASVDQSVMVAVEGNVGYRAAACQVSRCVRQEPPCLAHGAHAELQQVWNWCADAGEFVLQESGVEPEIVGHGYSMAQQRDHRACDVLEGWCVTDVGGADAMDMLRAEVAFRVDQRVPFAGHSPGGICVDDADLDDPVMPRRP